MKSFRITCTFSDPYPKQKVYIEQATKFDYASKKALSKFRKDFKGKRIEDFSMRCQDLGTIPTSKKCKHGWNDPFICCNECEEEKELKKTPPLHQSMDKALNVLNREFSKIF